MTKKPVKLTSENKLIQILQDRFSVKNPLVIMGIGDDAAVIDPKGAKERWLVTTDMLVEDVDFRRAWLTPKQLGYKSLAVNLSDLAAMGAKPRFYTVSLALPNDFTEAWVERFYSGMDELGKSQEVLLIGGDLSRANHGICISLTVIGESVNRKVVYRSGGNPGDLLYVTGILGKSAAGLRLLQNNCLRPRTRAQRAALGAHRKPEPRCSAGFWLAQNNMASCMMDLSDGLSMDLSRLCASSSVGAEIDASRLPTFLESALWGCDPLDAALHGGEDFELLFAVPRRKVRTFENNYPSSFPKVAQIGELTGGEIWIEEPGKGRHLLVERGYDHFRCEPVVDL